MSDIKIHIFRDTNLNNLRGKYARYRPLIFEYIIYIYVFFTYKDYTVLLSVATCHQTWSLHDVARKEELVHLAITGI